MNDDVPIPVIDSIHQTVYAACAAPDALSMGNWHTCKTTHCRAGWVVVLAGDPGRLLEFKLGTAGAALAIYDASTPEDFAFNPIEFFRNETMALADMKRLAQLEAATCPT